MSTKSWHIPRRTLLRGIGATLGLPFLEAMGKDVKANPDSIRRAVFCYQANGVSLPPSTTPEHEDWHWFPLGTGKDFRFTKVLESFQPLRDKVTVISGLDHPTGSAAHACGDIWLTCGQIPGNQYHNTISADQLIARANVGKTREPFLAFSCDGGTGQQSRIGTLSFDARGNPVPTESSPRRIFERIFAPSGASKETRKAELRRHGKMVDRVLETANALNRQLGKRDQAKLDEYLTSVSEIEERITRNEKWLDIPLKDVDTRSLDLDVNLREAPEAYYRTMFDLFALAFEADITRVSTFMMSREDGFGIADSFPVLLFNSLAHHALSHGVRKGKENGGGWENWSRYDQFVAKQVAYFADRLNQIQDPDGPVLDNTVLLFGSGCSTTHNTRNIPLLLAGGKNLGLQHGRHLSFAKSKHKPQFANLYLSLLHAHGVKTDKFANSTGEIPELFQA